MDLHLPIELAAGYHGPTQRARVLSEAWTERNLYCVACDSNRLRRQRANSQTLDFTCERCDGLYELKSSSKAFGSRVPDGQYDTMMRTLREERNPHLLAMQYDRERWTVANLMVIPGFALSPSVIKCRNALSATARRAGWIGCDIMLGGIPADARVSLIKAATVLPRRSVREQFAKLQPLAALSLPQRGWTLDVLNIVRRLQKPEFTLAEVQKHAPELQRLHPENRHVEAKVRQQLQVLRDLGLLTFVDNKGLYRVR